MMQLYDTKNLTWVGYILPYVPLTHPKYTHPNWNQNLDPRVTRPERPNVTKDEVKWPKKASSSSFYF